MFEERTILGFYEEIKILDKNLIIQARVDSGATIGSIDIKIATHLNASVVGTKLVKSSSGTTRRKLIKLKIQMAGREVEGLFSIIDRSHMRYPILIGQDILKQNFIIDPLK